MGNFSGCGVNTLEVCWKNDTVFPDGMIKLMEENLSLRVKLTELESKDALVDVELPTDVDLSKDSEPVDNVKVVENVKAIDSIKVVENVKPVDSVKVVESVKSVESITNERTQIALGWMEEVRSYQEIYESSEFAKFHPWVTLFYKLYSTFEESDLEQFQKLKTYYDKIMDLLGKEKVE